MYSNIVKNLYIGKSKLIFEINGKGELSDTNTIGDTFFITNWEGNLPDYVVMGNFWEPLPGDKGIFEITHNIPNHKMYVTGIPKGAILDNFRLEKTVWSSYYEDNQRGYFFQIVPFSIYIPKLIIEPNGSD